MRHTCATEATHTVGLPFKPDTPAPYSGMMKSRAQAWRLKMVNLILIFSDIVLAFFVWAVACLGQIFWAPGYLSGLSLLTIVPFALVWVGIRATQGLYPGYGMNGPEELRRQTHALLATLACAAVFALTFQIGDAISRLLVGLVFLGLLFCAPLMRPFLKGWMMRHGVWGKPVIIMGSDGPATRVEDLLTKEWGLGYKPVGVFDIQPERNLVKVEDEAEGMSHGDALDQVSALSRDHKADTLFLILGQVPQDYLANLANQASVYFRNVVIIPDPALTGVNSSTAVARDFAGTIGVEMRHSLVDPAVQKVKRVIDLVATVCGGLFILPVLLVLSGLVWIESRGSIFYRAPRMGRDGKLFACMKFRTMVPDAEIVLEKMLDEDPEAREEYRKYHKLRNDPRVTKIGRFLRKTSLDELPQLWNVLRGEMSLVGPRPYLPYESDDIGAAQSEILRVYPGITGPWQVSGRSNTTFDHRTMIDAYYVRNWSIWLDLVLLVRTVKTLVFDRSAC